jgi:hypothetical protein
MSFWKLGKKALAPYFVNHNFVHGWMYQQQQLDVATFDAKTEATVPVDYAATAALNAKYVLTCEFSTTANQLVALVATKPKPLGESQAGRPRKVVCDYWRM